MSELRIPLKETTEPCESTIVYTRLIQRAIDAAQAENVARIAELEAHILRENDSKAEALAVDTELRRRITELQKRCSELEARRLRQAADKGTAKLVEALEKLSGDTIILLPHIKIRQIAQAALAEIEGGTKP